MNRRPFIFDAFPATMVAPLLCALLAQGHGGNVLGQGKEPLKEEQETAEKITGEKRCIAYESL